MLVVLFLLFAAAAGAFSFVLGFIFTAEWSK